MLKFSEEFLYFLSSKYTQQADKFLNSNNKCDVYDPAFFYQAAPALLSCITR
jgi:hypothetical protein